MTDDVTGHPLFDGTFSTDAVATAAHALVQQLHDEAMTTIAGLADGWGRPVEDPPAAEHDEPVTYRDPATWSAEDDEDHHDGDDEEYVLPLAQLPALLPRARTTARDITARDDRHAVSA
jgi:hypothetical protein